MQPAINSDNAVVKMQLIFPQRAGSYPINNFLLKNAHSFYGMEAHTRPQRPTFMALCKLEGWKLGLGVSHIALFVGKPCSSGWFLAQLFRCITGSKNGGHITTEKSWSIAEIFPDSSKPPV